MDYENLIEHLRMHLGTYKKDFENFNCGMCALDCANAATAIETLRADLDRVTAELADCREKNAGLALALLFECAPNPDVAEKPAIEDILKVVFQPGYDVVTTYNPPDEDGLYTITVTGVISKEEYEAATKAREQDEQ